MWTLIKRELSETWVFMIGLSILTILASITIVLNVWYQYTVDERPPLGIHHDLSVAWFSLILLFFSLGFTCLGNYQMNRDRKNKISTFLITLPVSRLTVYLARVGCGLVCLAAVTLALTVVTAVTFLKFPRLIPLDTGYLWRMVGLLICLCGACYSFGLLTGWSGNKYFSSLGALGLTVLTISVVLFKGISCETFILLSVISMTALIRTWYKYTESSL